MLPTQVIKKPLITEKSTQETEAGNCYSFVVDRRANKTQIRHAVSTLYNVRVDSVRTQVRKEAARRTRYGVSPGKVWKKAIVKLHEGERIDLF